MPQQVTQKKQKAHQKAEQHTAQSPISVQKPDHPYLQAQGIIGNHVVLRRYGADVIQTKLAVSSSAEHIPTPPLG